MLCAGRGLPATSRAWIESGVADDLIFDPVVIEEIEAPPGFVVAVRERHEPGGDHAAFDLVQIVDRDGDMVERLALGEIGPGRRARGGV